MGTLLVIIVLIICSMDPRFGFEVGITMTAVWLASEIFKKNGFYTTLFENSPDRQLYHDWKGAKAEGLTPSMRNVIIYNHKHPDFTLLVGILVELPFGIRWFHTYGCVESKGRGYVIIHTWMGKGRCTFVYQSNVPTDGFEFERGPEEQDRVPDYTHIPHWYQRWPLYLWG